MSRRDLGTFVAFGAGRAVATLSTVAVAALIGRLFGPDVLGRWTLIAAAGVLLHTALVNWTHASTVRFGREEWARAASLRHTVAARLPLLTASLVVAAVLVVVNPMDWLARWFAVDSSDRWMVALFAAGVWLTAEAQAVLQATDRLPRQSLIACAIGASSVTAVFALHALGYGSLAALIVVTSLLPITGWAVVWLGTLWAARGAAATAEPVQRPVTHLKYGWPLLPGFALGYVASHGTHVLLGRLASVTDVGVYGMSYQFFTAVLSANSVLPTFLLPWLIHRHVGDRGAMRTYVNAAVPTLYALWMLATVWMVAFLPMGLRLLAGDQFRDAEPVLRILLIAVPSSVSTSLYTILFEVQGRLGRVVAFMLPTTVASLVCCVLLIPTLGPIGAAVATTVGTIAGQALYIWDQHRHLLVGASRVWALWAAGLALGIAQAIVGDGTAPRLLWAAAGTVLLAAMVRRVACVDATLVRQLLGNRLHPLASMINRVLVAAT